MYAPPRISNVHSLIYLYIKVAEMYICVNHYVCGKCSVATGKIIKLV